VLLNIYRTQLSLCVTSTETDQNRKWTRWHWLCP